jgi:type II secretory pathway pseudopilin PulG
MKTTLPARSHDLADRQAFTLAEVAVSLGISGILITAMVTGLTQTAQQSEWSGCNLAAQNLAQSGIEQYRAAKWDPAASADFCTQAFFPPVTTNILDVPVVGNNFMYATNTWTITDVGTASYPLRMVRVDCTWRFNVLSFGSVIFTNTAATLRAPDQ